MNIRDALILQSPSLTLQRAAHAEIAWLDAKLDKIKGAIDNCDLKFSDDYELLVERIVKVLEE